MAPFVSRGELDGQFIVDVRLELNVLSTGELYYILEAQWLNDTIPVVVTASRTGPLHHSLSVTASNVSLWWPKTLGKQPLYNISVRSHATPETTTTCSCYCEHIRKRVGFRTVELRTEPISGDQPGSGFSFRINGLNRFIRGANVIPPNIFAKNVDKRLLERLITGIPAFHGPFADCRRCHRREHGPAACVGWRPIRAG